MIFLRMPPEALRDRASRPSDDVWSFGVLGWEAMSEGGAPYPGLPAKELLSHLESGQRLVFSEKTCPVELSDLLSSCWREVRRCFLRKC